ncbi:hypothetical protein RSSM_03227 [Rhodopirellula sallentina SM41]|uniref:Uncharacterized protein n=1 Tax=Rhodopirellula sallentina SM41 TaxID=1263870 RepID=M5UBU4_9BACT|nr:hypothetical protein RSSM_03227 [Rhodopirellula sallentina SM41]
MRSVCRGRLALFALRKPKGAGVQASCAAAGQLAGFVELRMSQKCLRMNA